MDYPDFRSQSQRQAGGLLTRKFPGFWGSVRGCDGAGGVPLAVPIRRALGNPSTPKLCPYAWWHRKAHLFSGSVECLPFHETIRYLGGNSEFHSATWNVESISITNRLTKNRSCNREDIGCLTSWFEALIWKLFELNHKTISEDSFFGGADSDPAASVTVQFKCWYVCLSRVDPQKSLKNSCLHRHRKATKQLWKNNFKESFQDNLLLESFWKIQPWS